MHVTIQSVCTKQCSHSCFPVIARILMEEQTEIISLAAKKSLARIKIDYRPPTPARKHFSRLEKGNRQFCIYLVESTFLSSFYLLIHMIHTVFPTSQNIW